MKWGHFSTGAPTLALSRIAQSCWEEKGQTRSMGVQVRSWPIPCSGCLPIGDPSLNPGSKKATLRGMKPRFFFSLMWELARGLAEDRQTANSKLLTRGFKMISYSQEPVRNAGTLPHAHCGASPGSLCPQTMFLGAHLSMVFRGSLRSRSGTQTQ